MQGMREPIFRYGPACGDECLGNNLTAKQPLGPGFWVIASKDILFYSLKIKQIEQFVKAIARRQGQLQPGGAIEEAMQEAEDAAEQIDRGELQVALNPQGAFIRHLQHTIAEKYGLASNSTGRDPTRHVVVYRG